jgi:hypothetical protein
MNRIVAFKRVDWQLSVLKRFIPVNDNGCSKLNQQWQRATVPGTGIALVFSI